MRKRGSKGLTWTISFASVQLTTGLMDVWGEDFEKMYVKFEKAGFGRKKAIVGALKDSIGKLKEHVFACFNHFIENIKNRGFPNGDRISLLHRALVKPNFEVLKFRKFRF